MIVRGLTFSLKQGMSVAVVGPNGGGKSTLLEALAISSSDIKTTGTLRCPHTCASAYLPQHAESQRHFPLRVRDVVAGGLWHALGPLRPLGRLHVQHIEEALETVGLSGFALQPIAALSGGQFQRVLFARLIVQKAQLIFLDEPLSALDLPTQKDLMNLIQSWQTPKNAQMVILHDLSLAHLVQGLDGNLRVLRPIFHQDQDTVGRQGAPHRP